MRSRSKRGGEPVELDVEPSVVRDSGAQPDDFDPTFEVVLRLLNASLFEWKNFTESWSASWQWLLRPLKLALVAFAIYLGAPFWYDTLRRLNGIRRATGHQRET